MIPPQLLKRFNRRAVGILNYGTLGMWKSLAIHTLPPPIRVFDFEGGFAPLLPWCRFQRRWHEPQWEKVTDEERQEHWEMVRPDHRAGKAKFKPSPRIDVVYYDTQDPESYNAMFRDMMTLDQRYNSVAIDSLQEFTAEVQTFSRVGGISGTDEKSRELIQQRVFGTMQATGAWGNAQDRSATLLRAFRGLRDKGIFLYATCSEKIDKDYVTDPRNQGRQKEEPYSVSGAPNLAGQLVPLTQHIFDIVIRSRDFGEGVCWMLKPQLISEGSGAFWVAKDRTGRLLTNQTGMARTKDDTNPAPSLIPLLTQIYGEEDATAIYQHWQNNAQV